MIVLESRDGIIWNIDTKLVEIIKESISTDGQIQISTSREGPCLTTCGFYDKLDLICNTFGVNKQRFVIYTPNVEEYHDTYKIIIEENIWVDICKKSNLINYISRLI